MTTLEKIRKEILNWEKDSNEDDLYQLGAMHMQSYVLQIIDKYAEQEPCDDAISREMALKECHDIVIDGERYRVIQEETLLGLPSVTQKSETVTEFAERCRECGAKYGKLLKQAPKTGHWIGIDEEPHEVWECDHCGFVIDGSGCIDPYDYRDTYKYCPNCGRRMFDPQESDEISERNLKMWEAIFKAESEDKE